jgi:CheY-like chemotaxis protein
VPTYRGSAADVAASGEEALRLLAHGRRYDLVLCDVGMPGMTGWEVAQEIERVSPGTPVLLLTGWAQELARDDPKRRAVDGVLAKPLDVPRLKAVLHEWLAAPRPARTVGSGSP